MIVSQKEVLAAYSYCAFMMCDGKNDSHIRAEIGLTEDIIEWHWKQVDPNPEFPNKEKLSAFLTALFSTLLPLEGVDRPKLIDAVASMIMPEPSDINAMIKSKGVDTNLISDGYHTIGQLYDHRIANYIALCRLMAVSPAYTHLFSVWRSQMHSDGSRFDGWFVLGINRDPGRQVTYHLPMDKWEDTWFAETYEKAPCFDFHTPDDVLQRIRDFI